jgi:hypothetical protein
LKKMNRKIDSQMNENRNLLFRFNHYYSINRFDEHIMDIIENSLDKDFLTENCIKNLQQILVSLNKTELWALSGFFLRINY